jgi:Immunity protein 52
MKPAVPKLKLQYRSSASGLIEIPEQLDALWRFARSIQSDSPLFAQWYLANGQSAKESLRTLVFDAAGQTPNAQSDIAADAGPHRDLRSIALWNGALGRGEGATLVSDLTTLGRPNAFEFGLKLYPEVTQWQTPARWITTAVSIWPTALFATFAPLWHSERRIFQDRPGVGWMVYLPRVITAQQVPEARQLLPVVAADGTQRGTIVVSTTEGPYSDDNPEHLAAAHAIETRLVDQDLLPRYADL